MTSRKSSRSTRPGRCRFGAATVDTARFIPVSAWKKVTRTGLPQDFETWRAPRFVLHRLSSWRNAFVGGTKSARLVPRASGLGPQGPRVPRSHLTDVCGLFPGHAAKGGLLTVELARGSRGLVPLVRTAGYPAGRGPRGSQITAGTGGGSSTSKITPSGLLEGLERHSPDMRHIEHDRQLRTTPPVLAFRHRSCRVITGDQDGSPRTCESSAPAASPTDDDPPGNAERRRLMPRTSMMKRDDQLARNRLDRLLEELRKYKGF